MQLKMNSTFRPLLITTGLTVGVNAMPFSYQNYQYLDSNNNIAIDTQIDYITEVSNTLFFKSMFNSFFEQWEKQTRFSSSARAIVDNSNFQSIVAMRDNAVPFIIEKIKEGPTLLVWALNIIFNEKVSQKDISIEEAGKLWLRKLTA